jgi:hypothetical protein
MMTENTLVFVPYERPSPALRAVCEGVSRFGVNGPGIAGGYSLFVRNRKR